MKQAASFTILCVIHPVHVVQIIDCIVDECPDDKTKASVQKMLTDEKEQVGKQTQVQSILIAAQRVR